LAAGYSHAENSEVRRYLLGAPFTALVNAQRQRKKVVSRTGNPFKAFLDEKTYASNNFFSLQYTDYRQNTVENLKVVLTFIVSPLAQYFIRTFAAPRLGNTFVETKIIHLLKFRVPEVSGAVRNKLITVVDKIIEKRCGDSTADTSKWEKEANTLVYESYGLSEHEIAVIEGRGQIAIRSTSSSEISSSLRS